MTGLGARLARTLGAPPRGDAAPAEPFESVEGAAPPLPADAHDMGASGGDGGDAQPGAAASGASTGLSAALSSLETIQSRMARWIEPPTTPPATLAEALPGVTVDRDGGSVWVTETRRPLVDRHGDRVLGGLFERPTGHLALLTGDARLDGFCADDALFLDIEATGLDHGAGTLAFVIGLGRREGDAFVVRQLILREPADERALLLVLREALERARFLVSFNGKSYDLTVLQSRFVMQRLYSRAESELKLRPHLDLLHLSQNLYRGLWPDTRLGTLESRALGFDRVGDIPGHLVPVCWFAWQRHGDAEPLAAVARHNLDDVLSMVTLADRLVAEASPEPRTDRAPAATLNLARLLYRRQAFTHAATLLDDPGLDLTRDDDARALAARVRADCARRLGDGGARASALAALLTVRPGEHEARRELAMVLARLGRLGDAIAELERVLDASDDPRARSALTRLRRRLDRDGRNGRHAPGGRQRVAPAEATT